SNAGAERYMGLGSVHTVSLAEAREKALQARKLRLEGIDPIEHRDAQRMALKLEQTKALTFKQCAESYIRAHRAGWRSPKHAVEWDATLTKFVYPLVGELPVQAIDTALVIKTLEPIWTTIPDTANRIRVRIERILDSAKARGFRARKPGPVERAYQELAAGSRQGSPGRQSHRAALFGDPGI